MFAGSMAWCADDVVPQDRDTAVISELTFRECRSRVGLSQRQMAARLAIDLETCRVLDSGRRQAPTAILARARLLAPPVPVSPLDDQPEAHTETAPIDGPLLSLPTLAVMIGVHARTMWNAARRGSWP